jgi:alpha-N-arabinofuranosidase
MDKYDPEGEIDLIVGEWGAWHAEEPGSTKDFLYQQNSLRDALVAGISFNIFHAHAERVNMANIAQTVNVLQAMILTDKEKMILLQAMILTDKEKMILTPTYHVFDMYKVHQDATLLPSDLECEDYSFDGEDLPGLNVSASKDDSGKIHISICNLNPNEDAKLNCEIRGAKTGKIKGQILTAEKITSHNTFDKPEIVKPADFKGFDKTKKGFKATIPAKSIVVLEIR